MKQSIIHDGTFLTHDMADKDGWITFHVYESDFDAIVAANVEEHPEWIEDAKTENFLQLRRVISEKTGIPLTEISEEPSRWNEEMKKVEARWAGSWETYFYQRRLRGPKKLIALEVLEKGLPPPQTNEERALAYMAQSFRQAPEDMSDMVRALSKKLEDQEALIAKLQAKTK